MAELGTPKDTSGSPKFTYSHHKRESLSLPSFEPRSSGSTLLLDHLYPTRIIKNIITIKTQDGIPRQVCSFKVITHPHKEKEGHNLWFFFCIRPTSAQENVAGRKLEIRIQHPGKHKVSHLNNYKYFQVGPFSAKN